uniref:Nudix hydrolase domain-containing protein n=1 Tax=Ascaris lumbricoides TaxID=6252 RepID=A0A0M3IWJ6_ASCLU
MISLQAACKELREEFMYECALTSTYKVKESSLEFCHAYENVCFDIPEDEPDQPTTTLRSTTIKKLEPRHHHDYTLFCREYKQRYLYVCPNPLRFGEKAIVSNK